VERVGPMNALQPGAILVFAGVPAYWLSRWLFDRKRVRAEAEPAPTIGD
jgi:hypothetical protein